MADESIQYKKNMVLTLGMWLVFGFCAIGVMLYTAAHKTIVIADSGATGQDAIYGIPQVGIESEEKNPTVELVVETVSDGSHKLHIPVPEGVRADGVTMENRYLQRQLWIYLRDVSPEDLQNVQVTADEGLIETAYFERFKGGVILKLQMTDVFEYVSTMENGVMDIVCYAPHELYQCIVVVDPGESMESGERFADVMEQDVTLQVALMLQQKLGVEDCRLYFTRVSEESVDAEKCVELAKAVDADLYVALTLSSEEDEAVYGIKAYYNEEYFIPDFGNVQWADVLTRNVTIAANNRALGLFAASDDSVLSKLSMPAAEISLGYISNEQERGLLIRQDYWEKLAEGLANALAEVYTERDG